jgi:hypothetical protein
MSKVGMGIVNSLHFLGVLVPAGFVETEAIGGFARCDRLTHTNV